MKTSPSTIDQMFAEFANSQIWYHPNPGNGGDALIAASTFQLFRKYNIDAQIVSNEANLTDATVLYGGGGNLTPEYTTCASFITKWHTRCHRLIVLPQTVRENKPLLSNLGNNVTICCREMTSYEHVTSSSQCRALLTPDLALGLNLRDTPILQAQLDARVNNLYAKTLAKKALRHSACRNLKTLMAFRLDMEKTNIDIPGDNLDVSMMFELGDYSAVGYSERNCMKCAAKFLALIDRFSEIHTNRLHVAIAGHLLNKRVTMHPNSYFKNRAIYDFSLKDAPNISFHDTPVITAVN